MQNPLAGGETPALIAIHYSPEPNDDDRPEDGCPIGSYCDEGECTVKRFYYSAVRNDKECEGIIRADSIDSAKKKLLEDGYEEITLSILSSLPANFDEEKRAEEKDLPGSSRKQPGA